ncbi:MAG: hypothetical protein BHV69_07725 [Bacteroidales bacterium 52_46]|nr:MAG: hypothetical protein BHV69_07725 [Bacteroidales bacterium 52_46]
MNKSKLILKLALLAGYLLFSGFSAYFTASSLSLNLLQGSNLWFIFALVMVVAILAGWCLTNVIRELRTKVGASRAAFTFNLAGFLVFWAFSFTTNVHYFFVEKHGYNILTKELAGAKNYIIQNTEKSNRAIDEQKSLAQDAITAQVKNNIDLFNREIQNTITGHLGFGVACKSILKSTESILLADSKMYGDNNKYEIFDDVRDSGDIGTTQSSLIEVLQKKYTGRMIEQLNKKLTVIENYYNRKKEQNAELTELLSTIDILEKQHLPAVLKDGSVNAYYTYYEQQNGNVIDKMPADFAKECVTMEGDKIKEFNIYPSKRMFDTMSVWGDIFSNRLKGMTMLQWIIIALIFDIVSFILFTLFRKD